MILQGDVAFEWAVFHRAFVLLDVDDLFAVEHDLDILALTGQHHLVPFASGLAHVFAGGLGADDAAVVVVAHFVIGLAIAVEDLALDAFGDRVDLVPVFAGVGDTEVQPAVALLRQLVLDREDEVFVLLRGVQIGLVALPATFALAGDDRKGAILLRDPVALGLPAGQILAVEQRDEAVVVRLGFGVVVGGRDRAGEQWEQEQGDQVAFEHDIPLFSFS